MPTGLVGVSPYDGRSVAGTGNPTLIDNLASERFTNSRACSLGLRDVDSPDGKRGDFPIIFYIISGSRSQDSSSLAVLIPGSTRVLYRNFRSSLLHKLLISLLVCLSRIKVNVAPNILQLLGLHERHGNHQAWANAKEAPSHLK